jgi:hypothetical protein
MKDETFSKTPLYFTLRRTQELPEDGNNLPKHVVAQD